MGPEAEQARREVDERIRGALAATNTAVWELDLDRHQVTWSANLDALLKHPIDNLEQGIRAVHPADEPRVRAACLATIEQHRDFHVECRVVWPDGTVRWIVSEGRVVEASHGRPTRLIGGTTDVTDRHALEDQLRQSQTLEAVGRFAGRVAHDLNNLLTAILGYGQLLADSALDPRQSAEIDEVLQAASQSRTLARELIAFSRQQQQDADADRDSPASDAPQARAPGERKVLVVEDQAAVRALVRRILEREGFGVIEADESTGAERLFDQHQADIALVVADVGIPGDKGPVLFRRLVSKKPGLKVVYMSGQVEETALGDEPHAAHERFLAKPFTAAGLIGVVRDALGE